MFRPCWVIFKGKQLSLLEITNFIGEFPRSADLLYSGFFQIIWKSMYSVGSIPESLLHVLTAIRKHYLSICLSVYLSICLSVSLSIYLSISLFIYLSVCLSIYLSIRLSIYLSIFLSVCLSIYLCKGMPLCSDIVRSLSHFYLLTYRKRSNR